MLPALSIHPADIMRQRRFPDGSFEHQCRACLASARFREEDIPVGFSYQTIYHRADCPNLREVLAHPDRIADWEATFRQVALTHPDKKVVCIKHLERVH